MKKQELFHKKKILLFKSHQSSVVSNMVAKYEGKIKKLVQDHEQRIQALRKRLDQKFEA